MKLYRMRLGIMQPYFFPYLGYFSLIKHTDKWIVFDTVQFIRHGWIERNRVLKPSEGWQYIAVPLRKASRETLIMNVEIRTEEDWKEKITRQLHHYRKAPYFEVVINFLNDVIDGRTNSIVQLNLRLLSKTCEYLQIPFDAVVFSEMNLSIDKVEHPGQWALNICKSVGATTYVNSCSGFEIFKKEEFDLANIDLKFMKSNLTEYPQQRNSFEAGLSIIDVMMFNDVKTINEMLDNYELT